MKRINRQRSEETKRKISMALKGRSKSPKHREALSKSLKKYWASIPIENKNIS